MAQQKNILIPPDKVQELQKTQNVEISKSEKTLLQLAKEELNQITYNESDQLIDPERISSLIEIIKKYEKPTLPEGFGEDEFFKRFQDKMQSESKQKQKSIIQLQESQNGRTEKREQHFKRRFIVTAASVLILFSIIIVGKVASVDANTKLFKLITQEDGLLYYKNSTLLGSPIQITEEKEEFTHYKNITVTIDEFLKVYADDVYLPLELLKDLNNCKFSYVEKLKSSFMYTYTNPETDEFFIMNITKSQSISQQMYYALSKNRKLLDVDCGWDGAKIYYNEEESNLWAILELGTGLYDIESNMSLDTFLDLIRNLEIYK